MGFLNKEDILKNKVKQMVKVEVPEWGGAVYLGRMNLTDLIAFYEDNFDAEGENKIAQAAIMIDLLQKTIMDVDCVRIFGEEDKNAIAELDPKVITRLFKISSENLQMNEASNKKLKKN